MAAKYCGIEVPHRKNAVHSTSYRMWASWNLFFLVDNYYRLHFETTLKIYPRNMTTADLMFV